MAGARGSLEKEGDLILPLTKLPWEERLNTALYILLQEVQLAKGVCSRTSQSLGGRVSGGAARKMIPLLRCAVHIRSLGCGGWPTSVHSCPPPPWIRSLTNTCQVSVGL